MLVHVGPGTHQRRNQTKISYDMRQTINSKQNKQQKKKIINYTMR